MKLGVGKTENGWEVTFNGIFAPKDEALVFASEGAARAASERLAAAWRMAERAEALADGAHFDNY
jgi:hypothetical protein